MTQPVRKPFTGYHMFAIMVAFFGVVIGVNVTMARLAARSFGGEVVDNSYVASQHFNRWLDEAAREKALGWKISANRDEHGRVALVVDGVTASNLKVSAIARHPLGITKDRPLSFVATGAGHFLSREALPLDRWRLRIVAQSGTQQVRFEEDLR